MNPQRVCRLVLLMAGVVGLTEPRAFGALTPARLRCEYRIDPEGIDEPAPRLGWRLDAKAGARGVRQTAYQILVASSAKLLADARGDLWDTGKVSSDATRQIVYAGKPLSSRQRCWWQVRVWDEAGHESAWSAPARWSMGLVQPADWQAKWIGFDTPAPTDGEELSDEARARLQKQRWAFVPLDESKTAPLAAFVRGVLILPPEKKLARARLTLSPDQVCAITVNGKPAGEVTRWEQMRPVDLTALLRHGRKRHRPRHRAIRRLSAGGAWRGPVAVRRRQRASRADRRDMEVRNDRAGRLEPAGFCRHRLEAAARRPAAAQSVGRPAADVHVLAATGAAAAKDFHGLQAGAPRDDLQHCARRL